MSTPTTDPQDSKLVKIGKLLRLAERATTEAEATAFMEKATALAAEHRVDLDVARALTAKSERREEPTSKFIKIGKARTRGLSTYVYLIVGIGHTNNVRFSCAHNSTYVTAFGFPSDIEMTERIYEAVLPQMVRDWIAYRDDPSREIEYTQPKDWRDWSPAKPANGITLRLSFQEGYRQAVVRRLEVTTARTQNRLIEESSSTALAIRDSGAEVERFYKAKANVGRRSYKGGQGRQHASGAASSGYEAGTRARIGNERSIAATSYNRGEL